MLRIIGSYRNDLAIAVILIRMPQDRRDQKLCVHHQAAHLNPPGCRQIFSTRH
jgi:hypothetical protein